MTPAWLNDTLRGFGRQMGLKTFELNERGTAGVRFEDGRELRLEYADGALAMIVTAPVGRDAETAKRVLATAHPDARHGLRVRSGFFAKEGRAFWHARLPERDVAVDVLERAFRELWAAAASVWRHAS